MILGEESMAQTISIGKQDFLYLRENNYFYIDKTDFIRQWWESADDITLITRPRRFGKTLNMSMLNYFFSNHYSEKSEIFEKLSIWNSVKYRKLQGAYPVIFISFADVKQGNYKDAVQKVKKIIADVYRQYRYLMDYPDFTVADRRKLSDMTDRIDDVTAQDSLKDLSYFLSEYYKKKVIILLDEYDTPMQEAYVSGYWEELAAFTRSLFNSTFKTNPYLERGIMTGITRVSKESIFSDLNNLKVVTTTSMEYATSFGFTEKEVFEALDEQELSGEKGKVKAWYDGFTFGNKTDIYNPWSITNFLDEKRYRTFWASTSSNSLVSKLIQAGSVNIKRIMEELLEGKHLKTELDEQIVFNQLDSSSEAIWSLLLASGYLKLEHVDFENVEGENIYELSLTNFEVKLMFENMIKAWFKTRDDSSDEFVKAMFGGDLDAMNYYMNEITCSTFSCFDVAGKDESRIRPENFYHGFVLGLMVSQKKDYIVTSNRESGFGRYDIMLEPKDKENIKLPGIVIEFKVINPRKESSLKDTVNEALKQIEEKNYDAELIKRGVKKENIRHYGFAFRGKEVLIG